MTLSVLSVKQKLNLSLLNYANQSCLCKNSTSKSEFLTLVLIKLFLNKTIYMIYTHIVVLVKFVGAFKVLYIYSSLILYMSCLTSWLFCLIITCVLVLLPPLVGLPYIIRLYYIISILFITLYYY